MRAGKLDRLFERFRRKGDIRALGEVFDAAAPELYRVAVHLTRDLHQAEDLVQSTFLAAIEARDSYDAKRELLPWLLGILTRKSAWERRKLSRVIEPDRLQTRSAAEPSAEAETNELSASVAEAVERLPSPYREVLIAHLRAGKSPQEVALELGRAPGTVRVQLHRGLEMLRKALPVGLAMGGVLAAFSPRGLAAVRASVLRSAAESSTSVAAALAAAPATSLIGGIAVSIKAWVVAGGVVLGLAWLGFHEFEWTASTPVAAELVAGPTSDSLAVEPTSIRTNVPELAAVGTSPQRTSVESAPGVGAAVDTSVSGRLLLPDGTLASGAFVALLRSTGMAPGKSVTEGATSGDGRFNLRADQGAYYLVGLAAGFLPITHKVTLVAGSELRLEPISFPDAAHIRGWVRIAGTSDPTGCKVSAVFGADGKSFDLGQRSLVWSEGRLCSRSGTARTDAQGRFSIEGLEPRLHQVSVEGASRAHILGAAWEIQAPSEDVLLAIDYARVVVHVQCEGRPIDADVSLTESKRADPSIDPGQLFTPFGSSDGSTWGGLSSGSTAEALVPPGAAFLIKVEKEGYSTSGTIGIVAPGAGDTVERTIELKQREHFAELVIELVMSDGSKIEDAGFALFRPGPGARGFARGVSGVKSPDVVRDVHKVGGTFRLLDLPPGTYELRTQADGTWDSGTGYWYHAPIEVKLLPDAVEHRRVDLVLGGRLRVQCSNTRGAWLPAGCRLLDAWGTEIPIAFFTQDNNGSFWLGGMGEGGSTLNNSAPQGTNEVASNLPPGKYDVRFSLEGYADTSRTVTIEAGKTAEISVVLEDR